MGSPARAHSARQSTPLSMLRGPAWNSRAARKDGHAQGDILIVDQQHIGKQQFAGGQPDIDKVQCQRNGHHGQPHRRHQFRPPGGHHPGHPQQMDGHISRHGGRHPSFAEAQQVQKGQIGQQVDGQIGAEGIDNGFHQFSPLVRANRIVLPGPPGPGPVGAADGDHFPVRQFIALIFLVDPPDKGQVDAVAFVGAEKGLPLQLGQQVGQLAVKLENAAAFPGKHHMMPLLLQTEQLREREPLRLAVLPDSQPGGAVPLQLHQMQQVIDVFLAHRLFQIFQHRQPVALQGMLGAGGGKGDGDGFIHLPDFLYRLHAGHAVHVNVHQQQIEFAGAEGFQQFLTAPELGAVRWRWGPVPAGRAALSAPPADRRRWRGSMVPCNPSFWGFSSIIWPMHKKVNLSSTSFAAGRGISRTGNRRKIFIK